jgi:hypothetical protein
MKDEKCVYNKAIIKKLKELLFRLCSLEDKDIA